MTTNIDLVRSSMDQYGRNNEFLDNLMINE